MYILVEIIHTEFQYISLIEIQKYNWNRKRIEKRRTWKKRTFCPGCQTRDKKAPPFVPDWRSRLGNWDNRGFPTGTNQLFCSSVPSIIIFSFMGLLCFCPYFEPQLWYYLWFCSLCDFIFIISIWSLRLLLVLTPADQRFIKFNKTRKCFVL